MLLKAFGSPSEILNNNTNKIMYSNKYFLIRRRIAHRTNDFNALIEAWLHRRRYFFFFQEYTLQSCKISFNNENVHIS